MTEEKLLREIRESCATGGEALSFSVLCQSIGSIDLGDPLVLPELATVSESVAALQGSKAGGVMLVDGKGKVTGIFTERDCVLKVLGREVSMSEPVALFMTRDPVRERPETTIAFALNLMSNGGFRHLPIVDDEDIPIGMLSVKDAVDFLVLKMMGTLLGECDPREVSAP